MGKENKRSQEAVVRLAVIGSLVLSACTSSPKPKETDTPSSKSPVMVCHDPEAASPTTPNAIMMIVVENEAGSVSFQRQSFGGSPAFAPLPDGSLKPGKRGSQDLVNTGLDNYFLSMGDTVVKLGGCLVAKEEAPALQKFFKSIPFDKPIRPQASVQQAIAEATNPFRGLKGDALRRTHSSQPARPIAPHGQIRF